MLMIGTCCLHAHVRPHILQSARICKILHAGHEMEPGLLDHLIYISHSFSEGVDKEFRQCRHLITAGNWQYVDIAMRRTYFERPRGVQVCTGSLHTALWN